MRPPLLLGVALFAVTATSAAATSPVAPVVVTTSGPIAGEWKTGGRAAFRGVPFAAPPVGELRWRPPQAAKPWKDVRQAARSAPSCRQSDLGWNREYLPNQSEDCLYLEVGTPNLKPDKPLPVMVWIHGGANRAGGGAGAIEANIVDKGVVLVSIQYRLDALGFLSHPAFTAESPHRSSGNYGLMDQQAALRWVRDNIARFGGDPANVTIFGESAGGQDVGLQMLSPGARGLFHKVIAQSGTAGFGLPPRSLAQNEAVGEAILSKAGARQGASAKDLRALPAEAVLAAAGAVDVPALVDDSFVWLQAIVDGWVIPEAPQGALEENRASDAPMIIGVNARELSLHGGVGRARAAIAEAFVARAPEAERFYGLAGDRPPVSDPRLGDLDAQLSNDITFRCPAIAVSKARARSGHRIWQYQYDYTPQNGELVRHAAEIPFVLSSPPDVEAGAPPMQAYWVNFARSGDPNGEGLTPWPAYDLKGRGYLGFVNGAPQPGADLRPVCDLRSAP